ncbi:SLAC1 anion channel family protein, partial [Candidatus Bipolaricaulota bacterium]|nr:SLAC1 anion channel family protein [Candidatus Bipolaricaulota bacterium]
MTTTQLNATQSPTTNESRLANLPVPIFAIVMGMAGTAVVYLRAGHILWQSELPGILLTAVTTGLFAVLLVAYALKAIRYPEKVREESDSPIKLHFFPTISISLILLSVAFLQLQGTVALWLWVIGSVAHLYLTLKTLSIWIQKEHFALHHIEPSWFIPIVGNLLIPIAGVELAPPDISWFFFSIGLVFWVMLFTIFLYRIIFHHPLPTKRLPTFFILIAPPAVAFISYTRMIGGIDSFARVMY